MISCTGRTIGTIFDRRSDGEWDSRQIAGYAALTNTDWEGDAELRSADGRYYISYLAGATDGYEPDPLYMGLAFSADPLDGSRFTRLSRPISRRRIRTAGNTRKKHCIRALFLRTTAA